MNNDFQNFFLSDEVGRIISGSAKTITDLAKEASSVISGTTFNEIQKITHLSSELPVGLGRLMQDQSDKLLKATTLGIESFERNSIFNKVFENYSEKLAKTFTPAIYSNVLNTIDKASKTSALGIDGFTKITQAFVSPIDTAWSSTLPKYVFNSYDQIYEEFQSDEAVEKENLHALTDEEKIEVENDFKLITFDDKNWQQKFAEMVEKWKEKNPVIAWVLQNIILVILLGFMASSIYTGLTENNANIRQKPNTTALIVYNIDINQEVIVVREKPYYYEVVYEDKKVKEKKKGWIAKKNVKLPNLKDTGTKTTRKPNDTEK